MYKPIERLSSRNQIDSKLAFLARAAARFDLVEAGDMDLDEAFNGLVVCLSCPCSREMVERWEFDAREEFDDARRRRGRLSGASQPECLG